MTREQATELQRRLTECWSADTLVRARKTELAMEAGKLLEDVRVALETDWDAAFRATSHLAALLGRNYPQTASALPARGGLAPWQKRKTRDYIERHLENPIAVIELAELVSLSIGYFCRAFKESFGDTPHAHIMRMRLERVQELMLTTADPLSQIALACGLSDQAHLSRLFRQAMGETPSVWRRRHALGNWTTVKRGRAPSVRNGLPAGLAWGDAAD